MRVCNGLVVIQAEEILSVCIYADCDLTYGNVRMSPLTRDPQTHSAHVIKLELLAARNHIGASLNGRFDPRYGH